MFRELLGELLFVSAVWVVVGISHWIVKKVLESTLRVYETPEPVQTIFSAISSVVIIAIGVGYSIVAVVKILRIVWLCIRVIWRQL